MGNHCRKWGWWLVAALAVAVAASLLFRRCTDTPSGPAPAVVDSSAVSVPVVRDTMYVKIDGETFPVVREQPVETPGTVSGETSGKVSGEASGKTPGDISGETVPSEVPSAPVAAETVITLPVKDVARLLRQKSGRDIGLSTQAPDRISLSYAGKVDLPVVGEQDMDLSASFRIVDVDGDHLSLQLDNGTAKNAAVDLLAPSLLERLPAGLVESYSKGRAVINLSAVPGLKNQFDDVSLTGVSVDEEAIQLRMVKN